MFVRCGHNDCVTTLPAYKIVCPPRNPEAEARLRSELGVGSLLAATLVAHGYSEPIEAERFLNPKLDDLGDPKLLPDFDEACKAILGAKERGDRIYVHGDYDVDGMTSAALLYRFLGKIGCDVKVHVPHRIKEGYGIHQTAVEEAREMGAKLFLTCDCGVAAIPQVELAREYGMDVVITDHHEPGETLPRALAIVNPHRKENRYPYEGLAGVGVAFRVCEGIFREMGENVDLFRRAFLDLTCLGTIADLMELTGDNRIIAKFGLDQLNQTRKVGLKALNRLCVREGHRITAGTVGFQIAPRLNAAGRIDDAELSLRLLLTNDETEATTLAAEIDALNTTRKAMQKEAEDRIVAELSELDISDRYTIVQGSKDWHPGIIGLVAGRVAERFTRPAYIVSIDEENDLAKGSARSIVGFNLVESIWALQAEGLATGGGHAKAAGFSTSVSNLEQVAQKLEEFARLRLKPEDLVPGAYATAAVVESELNLDAIRELTRMEPFGQANPEPVFALGEVRMVSCELKVRGVGVVKVQLPSNRIYKSVFFGCEETPVWFEEGASIPLVARVKLNSFNGSETIEFNPVLPSMAR